jgi:hypothetical protein
MKRVLAISALLLAATTGYAQHGPPAIFSDGTFDDANWSFVTFVRGNGGSVEAGQDAGGNPPPSRRIRITVSNSPPAPAFSAVLGAHFNALATWDPQARGPIATVDFLEDASLLQGFGDGQATGLAIRQNGMVYIRQAGTTPDAAWTRKESLNVAATGVVEIFDGGSNNASHPDFAAGGAIEFGYYRADSTSPGANGYQILAAIDNWTVRVNTPCATAAECDYGDACVVGECQAGVCHATAKACDDGDACTDDACVAGACAFTPVACDDGVSCTHDACAAGACQSTVDFASIDAVIDQLLGVIATPPCSDDIPKKLGRKLEKKLRKAQKKLANADGATKAKLIANLLGRADSLLALAQTLLAGAQATGLVSAPCATALSDLLTDVSGCVSALPRP